MDDETTHTLATQANMKAYETKHHGKSAQALDTCTGQLRSASSGDYFMLGSEEPLVSEEDRETPLLLVESMSPSPSYRDALTGKVIGAAQGNRLTVTAEQFAALARSFAQGDVGESRTCDILDADAMRASGLDVEDDHTIELRIGEFFCSMNAKGENIEST